MANITIDGAKFTVKDGITIIEALDELKINVPRYCYHPGLSIAGNCRICQVEVEKIPCTVIACNTRVTEGMIIHTQSQKAKESQQVVLEFLLANHPLDCPVCDQSGECKLQDYYMDYGLYNPKFNEVKVKKTKKAFSIGPYVMLDQERCILCSRCVRFADEVTKTYDFGIFNRGDRAELNIYPGKELNNKYSGNVVDICPVGALTDKDFRFKLRVWYLGIQESICPGCSRGCNTYVHYERSRPYHLKNERIMRLKPRENKDVNQWWICDEGRYGYKSIDQNRIGQVKTPAFTSAAGVNGSIGDAVWKDALAQVAEQLKKGTWGVLASAQYTNEELYLMKIIFKDFLGIKDIGFTGNDQDGYEDNFLIKKDKNPNTSGALGIFDTKNTSLTIQSVLDKARRGELSGLFIFYHDLAKILGQQGFQEIRSKVKTIVYEGSNNNLTAELADFVLPSAVYAEKEGTFTNFEGRVQRIRKAVEPLPNTKPTWEALLKLSSALGFPQVYKNPEEIFNDLAKANPVYREMTFKKIGKLGLLWNSR